jgi:4-amino-4-deoxy-L-arabinose transferase-like glycosyltransferase
MMHPDRSSGSPHSKPGGRWGYHAVAGLLVAAFLLQGFHSIRALSTVTDESVDVAAGYSYWTTRDARMNEEHPVLLKMWLALPLLPLGLTVPTQDPSWRNQAEAAFTRVFLYRDPSKVERILLLARFPILLLGVLLAVFVRKWAGELWGPEAGLAAMFLFVFDPNVIANGSLATMDLGLAAFTFISMYYLWRWLGSGGRRDGLLAGIALGCALLSKYTALAFLPIVLAQCAVYERTARAPGAPRRCAPLIRFLQLAGGAVVVVIAVYAVAFNWHPLLAVGGEHRIVRSALAKLPGLTGAHQTQIIALAQRIWVPDVGSYVRGAMDQRKHLITGDSIFVMGRVFPRGVWYYYPLALLFKTPIPILLLVLLRLCFSSRLRVVAAEWFLVVPIVSMMILACLSTVDLGIRYLLPLSPLLFVWLSRAVALAVVGSNMRPVNQRN